MTAATVAAQEPSPSDQSEYIIGLLPQGLQLEEISNVATWIVKDELGGQRFFYIYALKTPQSVLYAGVYEQFGVDGKPEAKYRQFSTVFRDIGSWLGLDEAQILELQNEDPFAPVAAVNNTAPVPVPTNNTQTVPVVDGQVIGSTTSTTITAPGVLQTGTITANQTAVIPTVTTPVVTTPATTTTVSAPVVQVNGTNTQSVTAPQGSVSALPGGIVVTTSPVEQVFAQNNNTSGVSTTVIRTPSPDGTLVTTITQNTSQSGSAPQVQPNATSTQPTTVVTQPAPTVVTQPVTTTPVVVVAQPVFPTPIDDATIPDDLLLPIEPVAVPVTNATVTTTPIPVVVVPVANATVIPAPIPVVVVPVTNNTVVSTQLPVVSVEPFFKYWTAPPRQYLNPYIGIRPEPRVFVQIKRVATPANQPTVRTPTIATVPGIIALPVESVPAVVSIPAGNTVVVTQPATSASGQNVLLVPGTTVRGDSAATVVPGATVAVAQGGETGGSLTTLSRTTSTISAAN